MSWQALDWVRKQRVGHAHSKAVLVQLANFADDRGTCFPSHAYLADQVEVSERTIHECMKKLEADGYVVSQRDRVEKGRLGLTRYRLCLDRLPNTPPEAASAGDQPQTGAPPPEADNAATGSSFRSDTPVNHQGDSERGAGARGEASNAEAEARLERIIAGYPKAALDELAKVRRIWPTLSDADQAEAESELAKFTAFLANERRRPPLQDYLADRRWRMVAAKAAAKPETAPAADARVPPFDRAWWWLFFAFVKAAGETLRDMRTPEAAALRRHASAAMARLPWRIEASRREEVELAGKALVQIGVDHPPFVAWGKALAAIGVTLPRPDRAQFIFVPSEYPPELPADEDMREILGVG